MTLLLTGGRVLDPRQGELIDGLDVLIEGTRIREVSDRPIRSASAETIDLRGKTLMPGLIDCHVHVVAALVDLKANALAPPSLTALRAVGIMQSMLMRGFTTVRDCSGADFGLVLAIDEGLVVAPRLITSGKALSQTGGHSDFAPAWMIATPCSASTWARSGGYATASTRSGARRVKR